MKKAGLIPAHGNYEALLCHHKAEAIYDITYRFCQRLLSRGDRTVDQMVQTARSGKQNIVEGSEASGTSKENELKLMNVARASLANSSRTTATTSAPAISASGPKTPPRPSSSAASAPAPRCPTRTIGPTSKPAPPRWSPTSPSA